MTIGHFSTARSSRTVAASRDGKVAINLRAGSEVSSGR